MFEVNALAEYGALGIFCLVLLSAVYTLARLYKSAQDSFITMMREAMAEYKQQIHVKDEMIDKFRVSIDQLSHSIEEQNRINTVIMKDRRRR